MPVCLRCVTCVDNDVDDNTKSINQSVLSKKVVYADDEGRILVVSKQQPRQTEEKKDERKRSTRTCPTQMNTYEVRQTWITPVAKEGGGGGGDI